MPEIIRIIGLGNPLMGDDGIGIAVVGRLRASDLPAEVEVVDGGTGGLALLDLMAGAQKVLLVDAARMGETPGTVVRFTPEEIRLAADGSNLSQHAAGLPSVLALGREMGLLPPQLVVIGVEPAVVEPRLGLSPEVAAAEEEVIRKVREEVGGAECPG